MIGLVELCLEENSKLGASRMCEVVSVCRNTFYRGRGACEAADGDLELRDEMQRIAIDMTGYGYRRITEELHRRGCKVNHKRVLRLMREDNLLCLRKRRFVVTTDSEHGLPVYPNLTKDLVVDGPNQLWVADITYVRLRREFAYLAVILDTFSRMCVGWSLGRRLDEKLTLDALDMALGSRQIEPGLVHHSDRGVQYAAKGYTERLRQHGIAISMSRAGVPYDNAYAESFIKTLKYEEVYLWEYDDISHARTRIGYFIEDVYNAKRLHSAIGYLPPAEYEQMFTAKALT